jgi:hypothetical protein
MQTYLFIAPQWRSIMRKRLSLGPAAIALALFCSFQESVSAQVVEKRQGEANPAAVIFRSTLYGAGTGLVLGGAYALIEEDDDPSTGEILKWGTAGGAAAGFLIGLVYVITRSEPKGDAEVTGVLQLERGDLGIAVPTILMAEQRDVAGRTARAAEVNLVKVRF